ncbi:MAG: UMP kinase [Candidatus Gracilibacteria bacterium]|nr:UMP kinase [Candidatus Gracilibacteria bacterium]
MPKKNKRVLLKISGEALAGDTGNTFDPKILEFLKDTLKDLQKENIEIGIVIGGGNIFRGVFGENLGFDENTSHYMGMTATYINGLALVNYFGNNKLKSRLMTAVNYDGIGERFDKQKAIKYLEDGKVVVFVGGTGNPYFTTDTGGVLRAIEIEADMIIKATKVDGVYDKDPKKFDDAKLYNKVTYKEVLEKNLKVMDGAAIALARDEKIPLKVVNLFKKNALKKAILGDKEGTSVVS